MAELLTADEVGKVLKYPRKTVYELTKRGEFNGFVVRIGNRYRYDSDGLSQFIKRGGDSVNAKPHSSHQT